MSVPVEARGIIKFSFCLKHMAVVKLDIVNTLSFKFSDRGDGYGRSRDRGYSEYPSGGSFRKDSYKSNGKSPFTVCQSEN